MAGLSYDRLSVERVAEELATVSGWRVENGALTKSFLFDSYAAGVVFANAVAYVADALNHHPDLSVGYKKVTVSMVTHDAGGGLTAYDFELARRIDAVTRD